MGRTFRHADDQWCLTFLSRPDHHEASAWLRDEQFEDRTIGDLTHDESVAVVQALYDRGATTVYAVDLGGDVEVSEMTDALVVELPGDAIKRRAVLEWGSQHSIREGFGPIEDSGQQYMFLWWD